jgi:YidC/Oxa1 family membrane protein insertase
LTVWLHTGKDAGPKETRETVHEEGSMDNQRMLVWAAFGLLVFFTYQKWVEDYGPAAVEPTAPVSEEPVATAPDSDDLPALPDAIIDAPAAEEAPALPLDSVADAATDIVRVSTDVFDLEIATRGGTIQKAVLRNYPVAKDQPNTLVELLNPRPASLGLIQSGLRSAEGKTEANHLASFSTSRSDYSLDLEDELVVPLRWTDGHGITVIKQYQFKRGSYEIGLQHQLINRSDKEWRGAEYAQIQRRSVPVERSMFNVDTYSFDGPVMYDGEKSEKIDRDDLLSDGPFAISTRGGWLATIQHHFLSAAVPPADAEYQFNIAHKRDVAVASMIGPARSVAPGAETVFDTTLFVGPKLQRQLEEVTASLKLTVDYGWLTILSQPLFWLLSKVHSVVQNWGLAIIFVTILIKLAFYKLTQASGRSMAKMRTIQPRMKALQERYKDDRQQLSQAMMELYKREKVNPAAGCLPILIQMPFFLAFYWVLLESVEMRQAPFALWITDLSSRDPYFILPLIMGVSMLVQTRLNPAPADPVQAKVMQIMPIVFTGFFAFFPSGLVLYWVTNTILSIAQQWRINTLVEQESKKGKGKQKA